MNKQNLPFVSSILTERYTEAPKSERKTLQGYVTDSVKALFEGLESEAESAPTVFNDIIEAVKTDPVHSAALLRDLRVAWAEKFVSVIAPFDHPEEKVSEETDLETLKRLGIDPDTVPVESESIQKMITELKKKPKKSGIKKSVIKERYQAHLLEHAPGLYPEPIEVFSKLSEVKANEPTIAIGHVWASDFQPLTAIDNIKFIDSFDLSSMFDFSEQDVDEVHTDAARANDRQAKLKDLAENNGDEAEIKAIWNS